MRSLLNPDNTGFSYLRLIPQRIRDLNRHLSISLMAVLFVGGSVITSSNQSDAKLNTLFLPSPTDIASIVDAAKVYTPTIDESTDQVVSAFVDNSSQEVFKSDAIIAVNETQDPNALQGQGIVYEVQGGDSYVKIAKNFGLRPASIMAANGIDEAKIKNDPKALDLKPEAKLNIPYENIDDGPNGWIQVSLDAQKSRDQASANQTKNGKKNQVAQIKNKSSKVLSSLGGRDFTSYGGWPGGWCTAWAANLRPDIGAAVRSAGGGNAARWGQAAKAAGRRVDHVIEVGAVAGTPESRFGHVSGIVAKHGDTVTISEMNGPAGRGRVDQREIPISLISFVIH